MIAVATKYENVYIDTSACTIKRYGVPFYWLGRLRGTAMVIDGVASDTMSTKTVGG
jgi:hypothetical protein